MHCRQGRGTHRVDGNARTVEVEEIGHAIGDRGVRGAGNRGTSRKGGVDSKQLILRPHHADKDADSPSCDALLAVTGILDRFPRRFEKQALLRIYQLGLSG